MVHQAYAHFRRLDILVNNAGASLFAATEEASDEQIRGLFDANYFGMVRVLRAALPLLRKQGSGHTLCVFLSGLWDNGIAAHRLLLRYEMGCRSAHESLAQEVRAFKLKVTLVEPGAYATDFGKSSPDRRCAGTIHGIPEAVSDRIWRIRTRRSGGDGRSHPEACGRVEESAVATWPGHFYSAQARAAHGGAAGDGKRGRTCRMRRWASRRNRWRGLSNWPSGTPGSE